MSRGADLTGLRLVVARVWAIALNTFREAIRNRVLYVLLLFAVALMAFSLVLGELSMHEEVRIIKDLGLAGISLVGVVIALFLGVNLLSKELDRKTVYAILPKPLRRSEFLLGKYVGMALTLAVVVTSMAVVLGVFVAVQGGTAGTAMLHAVVLVLFELWLLSAVALLFSAFSSPYLSGMFTAALWVIGRNTAELRAFAGGKLEGSQAGAVLDVVSRVVPDFHLFYISGANLGREHEVSIHESFVGWGYVGDAGLYGLLYGGLCVVAAMGVFSRRDFT